MTGIVAFRKVQWGKESSAAHGTPVARTRLIMGTCNIPKDRNVEFIEDLTGRRGGPIRTAIYQYLADPITLTLPHGYFDALPGIFSMGIKGDITPSTGAGPSYTWTYDPVLTSTASNLVDSLTLCAGDDTEAYVMEYVMARTITLDYQIGAGAPVVVTAECFGRQVSTGAFTALSSTAFTFEPIPANMTKLYSDTTWAGLGGTEVANTLVSAQVVIDTGMHPKFFADGARYFSTHGQGRIGAVATFTFEGNSSAAAFYNDYLAQTTRAIRIETTGSLISGSIYNKLTVDMIGRFEEVIPMASDRDGNSLHTAIFRTIDDNAATPHCLKVTVINEASAV